jgi:hypothetical protein
VKCPKCKRGKYGYPAALRGVERVGQTRERWIGAAHPRGTRLKTQTLMRCLDCEHTWWSTLK